MKINKKDFEKVKKLIPVQRKPAKISNQQFLNALLYGLKRLQVEDTAEKIWKLAHYLH